MSELKTTKGTWKVVVLNDWVFVQTDDLKIAKIIGPIDSDPEVLANAHLIAAAPEMYAGLEDLDLFLMGLPVQPDHEKFIRANRRLIVSLLAKARGEGQ